MYGSASTAVDKIILQLTVGGSNTWDATMLACSDVIIRKAAKRDKKRTTAVREG